MKKTLNLILITLILFLLAGCDPASNGDKDPTSFEDDDITYEVTFNENYEDAPVNIVEVMTGKKVDKPVDPIRTNYIFSGWYLNDELYNFENKVTENITLKAHWNAILSFQGDTTGLEGDYIVLTLIGGDEELNNRTINWSSSDLNVATVVGGVVTLLEPGTTTITAEIDNQSKAIEITVEKRTANHLMQYFIDTAKDTLPRETITYVGSDDGSNDFAHNLYPSVVDYRFNDPIELVVDLLKGPKENYADMPLISLEWIVIHDTANVNAGAKNNHNWIHNSSNTITSWHYTVGNDGWYQALNDLEVGNQAFDGTDAPAGFTDTGIPATILRPKMEISNDGYFVILGEKTEIQAPLVNGRLPKTSDITEAGIWPVIINGTYHIPYNRYTTSYKGAIVITGGQMNGIGIETSVLRDTDIWVTWHRTAKLVAELLLKHDLSFDRVTFHNHFANKPCPRTAMESDNWDNWLKLIEFEYHVLKYYADYTIEFESLTPDILDNHGRVITPVKSNSIGQYKIIITSPEGEKIEHLFETIVNPK